MVSPIPWIGGKAQLVNRLLSYLPMHDYYLEPFGGAASLLFHKKPVALEVYNDIDIELVNFFRVLRDEYKYKEFVNKVVLIPYSRKEFEDIINKYNFEELSDIDRAVYFFVIIRMSFGGHFSQSWGYSLMHSWHYVSGVINNYLSAVERLPEVVNRLRTVQIEHGNWVDVSERYLEWGKDGLYYFDPPYHPDELKDKNPYLFMLSKEDHKELIDWLIKNSNKVNILLSGYDTEDYNLLVENGWVKHSFDTACHSIAKTKLTKLKGKGVLLDKHKRIECIWMNYKLDNIRKQRHLI